ncbi:DUF494 family protein [Natroniella sulfidigena]|uniref:DUF494 family protein n=1 Tax=Natroniella sulfidigena TaxID=723921 RepID=UPI00200ACF36|nr:DUF494 family protein [Natroniella sulfidigena]MCK8816542.1 DUF494 family protein [Natroniella sulfidigena]
MNNNVFKIISYLVKNLLHEEELVEDEEKLITFLRDEGYGLEEINQAFEFIFASSERINSTDELLSGKYIEQQDDCKHRVFSFREKFKFDLKMQGVILKLNCLNLIAEEELEELIAELFKMHNEYLNIEYLWEVLQQVIEDELRLSFIVQHISEFEVINDSAAEYIN